MSSEETLEAVMRGELDGPRTRAGSGDLPEVRVADVVVRIAVAGEVEHIEGIYPEAERLPFCDVEVFE